MNHTFIAWIFMLQGSNIRNRKAKWDRESECESEWVRITLDVRKSLASMLVFLFLFSTHWWNAWKSFLYFFSRNIKGPIDLFRLSIFGWIQVYRRATGKWERILIIINFFGCVFADVPRHKMKSSWLVNLVIFNFTCDQRNWFLNSLFTIKNMLYVCLMIPV